MSNWKAFERRAPILSVAILMLTSGAGFGQVVHERYQPLDGHLPIGPEPQRAVPLTEKGHTLVLPDGNGPPLAVFVFLDPRRFDGWGAPTPGSFDHTALSQGVGVLHLTTGNPLDFFFDPGTLRDVAERLQSVLESHGLRDTPLCFAGLSLGGTRALKLAIFLRQHEDAYWAAPTAVALVDAPLDMVRLWETERRAARNAFHPAAADEGRWVTYLLESHLGGTPHEQFERYVEYSPYTHSAPNGGNAIFLRDVALRAYHEPDVNWWIEKRRKSYYDMNSIDLAALVTELELQGSDRVELVTTHGAREGYDEGSSPHSWTIVDDAELVEWCLAQSGG